MWVCMCVNKMTLNRTKEMEVVRLSIKVENYENWVLRQVLFCEVMECRGIKFFFAS